MTFIIAAIVLLLVIIGWASSRLEVNEYSIEDKRINNDITITIISDLHGTLYGYNNEDLLKAIDETKPDIVLLPGDIYDDRYNIIASDAVIKGLTCDQKFMVLGNHEFANKDFANEINTIKDNGVILLRNQSQNIVVNNTDLTIIGCDDIKSDRKAWPNQLKESFKDVTGNQYKILLCHRPHFIEDFNSTSADLIVSGHAHGGQWCIPFTKQGILAPQQGVLPKYTSGIHKLNDKTMVISRGLSKHPLFIPRFFNRPEIVVVKLKNKTS